ncbi:MAG: hypothetical protein K8S13_22035 [Desulfobacula sp.]|uniref:hypothetical protein n=1 Tax=Desulfobacula sp. TaxID=2593537 RepID=UPI0025C1671F|nr:hypothetical protein [Desulfobacula sp.]MCD4722510.1 hypothetical protein [Desulfobacula sp.]
MGGLHGFFLVTERFIKKKWGHIIFRKQIFFSFTIAVFTYLLIVITWVFFRAQSFTKAFEIIYQMFHSNASSVLDQVDIANVLIISSCLFIYHFLMRNRSYEYLVYKMPIAVRTFFLALMLITLSLIPGDDRAFIYFQF